MLNIAVEQVKGVVQKLVLMWAQMKPTIPIYVRIRMGYDYIPELKNVLQTVSRDATVVVKNPIFSVN